MDRRGDDAQIWAMLSKESPCRKQFLLRWDANGSHSFIGGIKPVFDKPEAQQVKPEVMNQVAETPGILRLQPKHL